MMQIRRKDVADQIARYLRHDQTVESLVGWAEHAMMDAEFDDVNPEALSKIVARLGVSDVRSFGLTWEECESMLNELGCSVEIRIVPAS